VPYPRSPVVAAQCGYLKPAAFSATPTAARRAHCVRWGCRSGSSKPCSSRLRDRRRLARMRSHTRSVVQAYGRRVSCGRIEVSRSDRSLCRRDNRPVAASAPDLEGRTPRATCGARLPGAGSPPARARVAAPFGRDSLAEKHRSPLARRANKFARIWPGRRHLPSRIVKKTFCQKVDTAVIASASRRGRRGGRKLVENG
jgi:hypothetical protein